MLGNPKHTAAAILLKLNAPEKKKPEAEEPEDDSAGFEAAFEELKDALDNGDTKAGAAALKNAVQMCMAHEGDEPEAE